MCHSKCHPQRWGARFYIRKVLITWSPLTESNRRPSPYHLKSRRFSGRPRGCAGHQQAGIQILPQPAASATAPAVASATWQRPTPIHALPAAAPARARAASQGRPVGLHVGQPRPGRRSRGGQTIFPTPPAYGPQPTLNRHSPTGQEEFEPSPLSAPRRKSPAAVPEPCLLGVLWGSGLGRTGHLDSSSRSSIDQNWVVTPQVLREAACLETAGVRAAATTNTTPTETCCRSSPRNIWCNIMRQAEDAGRTPNTLPSRRILRNSRSTDSTGGPVPGAQPAPERPNLPNSAC